MVTMQRLCILCHNWSKITVEKGIRNTLPALPRRQLPAHQLQTRIPVSHSRHLSQTKVIALNSCSSKMRISNYKRRSTISLISQKLEYRINILLRTLQRKETALKEAEANIYKEADDSSDNLDNFRIKLQEITTTLPSSMRGKPPSGARPIKPNKSSFRNEKFPKQGKFKALRFKADMDLIEEEEDVVEIPKEVIKGNTKSNDIEMTILKPKPQGNTQANDKIIKKAPTPVKTDRSTKIIDLQAIAGTSTPVKDAGETSLEATSNETLSQEPRAITTKGEHSSGFKKWIKSIFHVKNTELMG